MTVLTRPRAALAVQLVPRSAAGRDPLFFFGTLMHHEVLETVVDRKVADDEILPATLNGYRRERAAGASYPVLLEDGASQIRGRLLLRPTARCIARINHFEDEEYRAAWVTVRAEHGLVRAWTFLPLDGVATMRPSGEPWDLDRWASVHLDAFRSAIAGWMADAPV